MQKQNVPYELAFWVGSWRAVDVVVFGWGADRWQDAGAGRQLTTWFGRQRGDQG